MTTTTSDLAATIGNVFASPDQLDRAESQLAVEETIDGLDRGEIRLAEKSAGDWVVHSWVQQAILLYFRLRQLETWQVGQFEYHDKLPLKHDYERLGVRVVPPATARYGSFLEPGVIMMPSYVNIGARVGSGTMVDTWATVGSGAQIGRNVHLAGGVGIGGVLEPPGARPVIVEDGAFIGSRCIITEGTLIEEGAVLGANVVLTSSTPIIDVTGSEPVTYRGRVPARSVVVPGSRPRSFPAGEFQVACALIIGQRTESTDLKTSLNPALRDLVGL
ncbi:MAG: 2,3,4,5-tetrahydropyridine-2,6-dicarboxylate N-succinyltransferase [Chloroflexi bacterium]|nr:2,3,4,5-tetrahydropyridine-2,6-dicarboxylate N-succinyltransferase [Chloroflexota bacterium]MBV9895333.1 2,3,4,5-tetrahydropyridine-2,6-dicarboxylate N-succinyltransferase [Chloroflexota bacterium]